MIRDLMFILLSIVSFVAGMIILVMTQGTFWFVIALSCMGLSFASACNLFTSR